MDIDSLHAAACEPCDSERCPAGTTGDIQKVRRGIEIEPFDEQVMLLGGEPAILTNILAERVRPDQGVQVRGELPVLGIVVSHRFLFLHLSLARFRLTHG